MMNADLILAGAFTDCDFAAADIDYIVIGILL